jgi:hypothetical protein
LKGALPRDLFSEKQYPKVFAWHERFSKAIKAAKAAVAKPTTLKGDAALQRIVDASFAEQESVVDEQDPLGLRKGTEVEVWPIDTGVRHRDRGCVVGLSQDEIVLSVKSEAQGKEIRVHFPRTNFRIRAVKEGATVAKL